MADDLRPLSSTDASGFLPGPLGLRLDEAFLPLTAIHADAKTLDQVLALGHFAETGDALTLRFSPEVAWHSGPLPSGAWRSVDISHGFTHLRLRGVEALHFLANYTTADLHSAPIRKSRAIRTKLNHFECAIWWANTRDIHILTDRSLAQSFCEHLGALALRHTSVETPKSLRPIAPDAPYRRG